MWYNDDSLVCSGFRHDGHRRYYKLGEARRNCSYECDEYYAGFDCTPCLAWEIDGCARRCCHCRWCVCVCVGAAGLHEGWREEQPCQQHRHRQLHNDNQQDHRHHRPRTFTHTQMPACRRYDPCSFDESTFDRGYPYGHNCTADCLADSSGASSWFGGGGGSGACTNNASCVQPNKAELQSMLLSSICPSSAVHLRRSCAHSFVHSSARPRHSRTKAVTTVQPWKALKRGAAT